MLGRGLSGQSRSASLTLSVESYFRQGWDGAVQRATTVCLCSWTGSPREDRAWSQLSHPVSPALPSKVGPRLRVWLNEKLLPPSPSWAQASAQNPEGGQSAPLTAPGLNTPFPPGQA